MLRSCISLYLPNNFPRDQAPWYYAFGYNKTHASLDLDYGLIINHHENANTKAVRSNKDLHCRLCQVRRVFNVRIAVFYKYACTHTHTQRIHAHINTFKATKAITAGQEIFIRYGNAQWFERKKIPFADVDYASTMWRPGLQPLPCRVKVAQTTGADGRRSFAVLEAVPSGAVLEISRCLEVSVGAVDQFPFLWDFVLTGETEKEYTGCQQIFFSSRAHTVYAFADQGEGNIGERAERVLYFFISPLAISRCPNP